VTIRAHLSRLPADLAQALEREYQNLLDHYLNEEWGDAEVDAGRFCEAVLRLLEWHTQGGKYTPIDGKSKPSRKAVVAAAQQDTALAPTLRQQIPQSVELMMDFRNNRNSAHLGAIEASYTDAATVMALASWVIAEIVRLETSKPPAEVQALVDALSQRQLPLVQMVGDTPVVLDPKLTAGERALVLLFYTGAPVPTEALRKWAEYGNATRWRISVLGDLRRDKLIHVDAQGRVHLLRPGVQGAQKILKDHKVRAV
jgi:hypothetical protein